MDNITTYSGIYKDENGEFPIQIANDLYDLSFTIDDLRFVSIDLKEWRLTNHDECSEEHLGKFSFTTYTTQQDFNLVTEYLLKDCEICFTIPQQILNKELVKESNIDLNISIVLAGKETRTSLQLNALDIDEQIANIPDFDFGLKKINSAISKKYTLFNCYNCRLSSYNVYGQSLFGSLQCYKKHKERFLKIKDKSDYIYVQEQGYETVQETYCCDEFQLPNKDQFLYK